MNAVVFYLLRPGVPDLWAARARASAVSHGVGLTYWFSWFGGSTPGNYSVITPYLGAALGTEFIAAVAALAISMLATSLVRGSRRPTAASWVVAIMVVINLWCGRVPFLLGSAFGVAALVYVQRRRKLPAAAMTILSVLASPVSGAFLVIGLSGLLMARRARGDRLTIVVTVACACGTLAALALLFGTPGPEPFPPYLLGEVVLVLGLLMLSAPPGQLRVTLAVSAAAALVVFAVPNGLGANFARLALFALPPVAVALSRRPAVPLAALTAPIVVLSALSSGSALASAAKPASSPAFYAPLAAELDTLHITANHRLELVDAGHAAYAVLLDHAVLARGWETQEDFRFNSELQNPGLDARTYKAWLDNNAVGLVALKEPTSSTPEARVVIGRPDYLREIWTSGHWRLFEVLHPKSVVAEPARLVASTQSAMTVQVPCACRISVRVRWSKYLSISPQLPAGTPDAVGDLYRPELVRETSGWTTVTTNRAGTYVLGGSP